MNQHQTSLPPRAPIAARVDRLLDRFGLFMIVAVCLAADRLPQKSSSRPLDRAIGYAAAVVIGAVGIVGRLIDRLSGIDQEDLIRHAGRRPDSRVSRAGLR